MKSLTAIIDSTRLGPNFSRIIEGGRRRAVVRDPIKPIADHNSLFRHVRGSQRWAASELGVTMTHLNLVLNGKRESRRLTRRYRELMASLTQEAAK